MRILSIALKDLRIIVKDKKALSIILLMPIVLIALLGLCLSSMFSSNGITIKKFDVAYVDKDGDKYAQSFKDFLKSDGISKMINLRDMSENESMDLVKKGDITAVIIMPEGYSKAMTEGTETKILVYKDPGSPFQTKITESIVGSYTGVASSVQTAIDAAGTEFSKYNIDSHMVVPEVMNVINSKSDADIKESSLKSAVTITAMQYYSAAMLVMYALFVAMIGAVSIIQEREQKTLLRLMSTTVSRGTIITGKLLGLFILGILDAAVLILFTKFIFNVNWGNSIPGVVILTLSLVFATSGLAMMIATLFKSSKAVDSVGPPLIMVMGFLGGSMFPLGMMPPVLDMISRFTLNNQALRGFIDLFLGKDLSSVVQPSLILCAAGAIFLAIGSLRLKLN